MGGPAVGISTVQVQSNCRLAVICDIICLAAQELGYDSGTPEQRLVIESFVKVRMCSSVFRLGRESRCACYWLLPAIYDKRRGRSGSILVVVSPLRALMKDQLTKKGATAVCVGEVTSNAAKY